MAAAAGRRLASGLDVEARQRPGGLKEALRHMPPLAVTVDGTVKMAETVRLDGGTRRLMAA